LSVFKHSGHPVGITAARPLMLQLLCKHPMLQRLVPLLRPPLPPPEGALPASQPLVITVTASQVLFCIALLLAVRVLRLISRLREVERAAQAPQLSEPSADTDCWVRPSALDDGNDDRSPSGSDTGSFSDSSPTPQRSEHEAPDFAHAQHITPQPGLSLLPRSKRPALDLDFARKLASKEAPWRCGLNVDEQIANHKGTIVRMLAAVEGCPGFNGGSGPGSHDELFALRFLLSHKLSYEKATAAMRTTLEWRLRNGSDKIREFVRHAPQSTFPAHEHISAHFPTPITVPGDDFPPFMFINASVLDPGELMKRITIEDYVCYSMHMSEYMAVHCDEITRRTRHLTKVVRVVAMG